MLNLGKRRYKEIIYSMTVKTYILELKNGESITLDRKRAILEACGSGDLQALETLLRSYNIVDKNDWIRTDELSGPPTTTDMVTEAVTNQQVSTLTFLLQTFPDYDVLERKVVLAAMDNTNLEILEVLQTQNPNFIIHDLNHIETTFCRALENPDPRVAEVFVKAGADLNGAWRKRGALYKALVNKQPLNLVKLMVERGALLGTRTMETAMEYQRLDVLQYMFCRYAFVGYVRQEERKEEQLVLLKNANKSRDQGIIKLVEYYVKKQKRLTKRDLAKLEIIGTKERIKAWWQSWRFRK